MKVLLTGATGFVGSHILDSLCESRLPVRLLLRRASDTRFIAAHLPHVEVRYGSLDDPAVLSAAMEGVEAVVHCAGKVRAIRVAEFYEANQAGARQMALAANTHKGALRQFIHLSSLAAVGPAGLEAPAREEGPPHPVSEYGRSKLLGEEEVRRVCEAPFTILRPGAVYGPRDTDFLHSFRLVRRRLMPLLNGGRMPFALIYVRDLAEAVRRCLGRDEALGKTYHVAHPEPCSNVLLLQEIAAQMDVRPLRFPVPVKAMYPLCLWEELWARFTGRPSIVSRQKLAELGARGWAASVEKIRDELGFVARTSLREGVAQTLAGYRRDGWL